MNNLELKYFLDIRELLEFAFCNRNMELYDGTDILLEDLDTGVIYIFANWREVEDSLFYIGNHCTISLVGEKVEGTIKYVERILGDFIYTVELASRKICSVSEKEIVSVADSNVTIFEPQLSDYNEYDLRKKTERVFDEMNVTKNDNEYYLLKEEYKNCLSELESRGLLNKKINKDDYDIIQHNGKEYIILTSYKSLIYAINSSYPIYIDSEGLFMSTPFSKSMNANGCYMSPSILGTEMSKLKKLLARKQKEEELLQALKEEEQSKYPVQLSLFDEKITL